MNERQGLSETKETIAKALEIAIMLTKADRSSIITNQDGNILVQENLLSTIQSIIGIINSKTLANMVENSKNVLVYPNK